jgi:prepilin-type N-terminal cleavage/methylation domain-containing protein
VKYEGLSRARSKRRKWAFTLIEVMVTVLILALITAISVPNFLQTRATSRRTACLENLRLIEQAKDQLAMSDQLKSGASVGWPEVVPAYIKVLPRCPTGGVYTLNPVGSQPECSLSAIGHHQ